MAQDGQKLITIHILPDIPRHKGNQTTKCVQLIEYNMRNTFLEKSNRRRRGEASPTEFYKKSKLSISLGQQTEIL